MLKKTRLYYFVLIIFVIISGIASRKIDGIPTYFGDMLYAIMVYFGMRLLFIKKKLKKALALALIFCFCIEFLQLYDAQWMLTIRRTTLGHYVLGQGFLWSDLFFYTLGITIALLIDFNFAKKN